jgi:DNA-binding MarR family transcriptional regulator
MNNNKLTEETIMTTYANQKIIRVVKAEANKENIYAIFNKEHLFEAMQKLTHNELKVYLYIISNQDNYTFALSTTDIANKTGANKRKVQEAINTLMEKGYIEPVTDNKYEFYE